MNKKIGLGVIVLWVGLAPFIGAQPKVGPLDGAVVESLPALGMPMLANEEELFNPALPLQLETAGMLAAASLEWARLAPDLRGTERQQTLEKLAELSFRQNQKTAAAYWLKQLQKEFPEAAMKPSLLVAQIPYIEAHEKAVLLSRLQTELPDEQASVMARWNEVWQEVARTGVVKNGLGIPEADQLARRLEPLVQQDYQTYYTAVAMSVIPGLGHVWLGAWAAAAMLLLGWGVLGLAFVSACRHRHYAYAFVFVFPWVGLWMNAPLSVAALADAQAIEQRLAAMTGWQDLRPGYTLRPEAAK